jgi:hypothetical protein
VDEKGNIVSDDSGIGAPVGIGSTIPLSLIWSWFDEPYGHEVPLVLHPHKPDVESYFVPYLSAIQLFAPPPPPSAPLSTHTSPPGSPGNAPTPSPSTPPSISVASSSSSLSSSSSSSSHVAVNTVSTSTPASASTSPSVSPSLSPMTTNLTSSASPLLTIPPLQPLFEYYERAGPNQRVPLMDKIKELAHKCKLLLTATNRDIDLQRSWYLTSILVTR